MDTIREAYRRWVAYATADPDVIRELAEMANDPARIEDAFYKELAFGTGGLRGIIGAGTNRMNVYTVARVSQGLANYVMKSVLQGARRIAVSYDSRIKSDVFARVACGVFAAHGIEAVIYPELAPTPCLSYAVRALGCAAGVMITASHNPAAYNGYKVYGADGCQITTETAARVLKEIQALDAFADVRCMDFDEGVRQGKIVWMPPHVIDGFVHDVIAQSVLFGDAADKQIPIVYTPLNGTGRKPILRALGDAGFTDVSVVGAQEMPDGHFPTCPSPNPETPEALELGLAEAKRRRAELLIATDPDCDRVGVAAREKNGEYRLLTGNETGVLLLYFICEQRTRHGHMPDHPVLVKTIVTTDMAERIAQTFGIQTVNVLTGFKFIGEQIGRLEAQGRAGDYLFGFEESYGCLAGTYVRDKDAVVGALLIAEMAAYERAHGSSLCERLDALYAAYGYFLNTLYSFPFEGSAGFAQMQRVMARFRANCTALGTYRILSCTDYAAGVDGLPPSDVLKFCLNGNCSVVVRPSGTEPKLKVYLSVCAENKEAAKSAEIEIADAVKAWVKNI